MNIELEELVVRLESYGSVILLESQSHEHPASKKSYLAALPEQELIAYDNSLQVKNRSSDSVKSWSGDPWEALKQFREETDGWVFGYLGYDLKNHVERLQSVNQDPVGAPDLYMINPGLILELDGNEYKILKGEFPDGLFEVPGNPDFTYTIGKFTAQLSEREYYNRIKKAQIKIQEGDFYEINLSHQMSGIFSGSAPGLYREMKKTGPVPFGAYLSFDQWRVCCASPERFLAKSGDLVYSQPIKGTIGRGKTGPEDERMKNWLRNSEKNRAENLMIVDLVRNDLGRIAKKGTVNTSCLFEIQSFGTVHQMVSTIEARAGDFHPVDILKNCFPMGSMTGAPKISSMKTIDEIEDYRRGIYSGAIGYMTSEGDFDFNVVIRTAIIKGDKLFYPVGGAITSDSDPKSEWEETLVKASALVEAGSGKSSTVLSGRSN